ncbi:MAG TPA: aromatase/cyclase [Clostridia bacterium]
MKKDVHEILINCEPIEAFLVCIEVEKWPDIFPPCHAVKVIERSETHIVFEITADTEPGKIASWVSRREIDKPNMIVTFKQTKPANPLKSMEGEWIVEKTGNQTRVALVHIYDVNEEDYEFVRTIMDRNSKAELKAIKEYLEK